MTINDMRMVHQPATIRRRGGVDWVRLADWELLGVERDKFCQLWVQAVVDVRKQLTKLNELVERLGGPGWMDRLTDAECSALDNYLLKRMRRIKQ